jgi:uncharacterized protein YdiU (UPF0061 family)
MIQTPVDYTIFFRELSTVPDNIGALKKRFFKASKGARAPMHPTYETDPEGMDKRWSECFGKWKALVSSASTTNASAAPLRSREEISRQMKLVNPKYSLREWLVVPAYQQASVGNYSPLRELQDVITQPYAEQSKSVENKFYRLIPSDLFPVCGISYYSFSS